MYLLPRPPYNQQSARCFKGGELRSWAQDPTNAVLAFQVGKTDINQIVVTVPQRFTLITLEPSDTRGQTNLYLVNLVV